MKKKKINGGLHSENSSNLTNHMRGGYIIHVTTATSAASAPPCPLQRQPQETPLATTT